jgi:hypothetical protein
MTKYMLLTRYGGSDSEPMDTWTADEGTAHLEFLRSVNRDLVERGELVDGQALAGPDAARFVTAGGAGDPIVTDGPYAEFKELLAGYQIVDVASPARAIEIAARISAAPGPGGVPVRSIIEVREIAGPLPGV